MKIKSAITFFKTNTTYKGSLIKILRLKAHTGTAIIFDTFNGWIRQ